MLLEKIEISVLPRRQGTPREKKNSSSLTVGNRPLFGGETPFSPTGETSGCRKSAEFSSGPAVVPCRSTTAGLFLPKKGGKSPLTSPCSAGLTSSFFSYAVVVVLRRWGFRLCRRRLAGTGDIFPRPLFLAVVVLVVQRAEAAGEQPWTLMGRSVEAEAAVDLPENKEFN